MLAVVQYNPTRGERAYNLDALSALTSSAARAGAKVIVLPEMAATGYRFANADAVRPLAEPPDGPTFSALSPLAKEYRAHIVGGFAEDSAGTLFNAAIAIGPGGTIVAHYRKRVLYDDDLTWATPGDLPHPIFHTPYGTATLGICMDINGPHFCSFARRMKPALICFPTNWIDQQLDYIHQYWAWRLRGWEGWLIASNRWGEEDGVGFWGRSAILKAGQVMAAAPAVGDGWECRWRYRPIRNALMT